MKIVHNFENPYIIRFLKRNADIIEDLPMGKYEQYQIGRAEDHVGFKYSLCDDIIPFGMSDDRIAINESQCIKLGFEEGEKDACIFHEIGHILCPLEKDGLKKEIAADCFAVEKGFKENLVSALKKMATSDIFNKEMREEMMKRVEYWNVH